MYQGKLVLKNLIKKVSNHFSLVQQEIFLEKSLRSWPGTLIVNLVSNVSQFGNKSFQENKGLLCDRNWFAQGFFSSKYYLYYQHVASFSINKDWNITAPLSAVVIMLVYQQRILGSNLGWILRKIFLSNK